MNEKTTFYFVLGHYPESDRTNITYEVMTFKCSSELKAFFDPSRVFETEEEAINKMNELNNI